MDVLVIVVSVVVPPVNVQGGLVTVSVGAIIVEVLVAKWVIVIVHLTAVGYLRPALAKTPSAAFTLGSNSDALRPLILGT